MKVYEADLYRWEGDISVLKKLKWLLVPRYRIVYLKRKCELHADKKHYIRFLFYRFFYQIHISIYSTEIGRRVEVFYLFLQILQIMIWELNGIQLMLFYSKKIKL